MTPSDVALVRGLLAAAGDNRQFDARLAEFGQLGESGCDLLFAARHQPAEFPVGAPKAHPRDVAEDVWSAFIVAAQSWPDRFLQHVLSDPDCQHDLSILDALGKVDRPQSRELLIAAANQRKAGHAFGRQFALQSLIDLADPHVPDLLVRLVKDRDSSVRFAAIEAAIEHGDSRLIATLQQVADSAKTAPGTREYAIAAIAAINAREN